MARADLPVRVNDLPVHILQEEDVHNRVWAAATWWTYVGDGEWWATSITGVDTPRVLRARVKSELPINEPPRDGVLRFCGPDGSDHTIRAEGARIT